MSYRAIYAYAWDIAEVGVPKRSPMRFSALGLNTVTLAGAYHAGKFLRPHGISGKVYFPEDGTVYFRADPKALWPHQAGREQHLRQARHLSRAGRGRGSRSMRGWCSCTTRGLARPIRMRRSRTLLATATSTSSARRNPTARDCAVALCRTSPTAIRSSASRSSRRASRPIAHGFHHEFALMKQNRWLDNLLGLCFCDALPAGAKTAGIDADGLRDAGRAPTSKSWLAADFDIPDDMAEAFWLADTRCRRRARRVPRLALRRRDVAGHRDQGGGPQGRGVGDHPFGGAADRRLLVRGNRSRGAGKNRRHHRGVLLRADRPSVCASTPGM